MDSVGKRIVLICAAVVVVLAASRLAAAEQRSAQRDQIMAQVKNFRLPKVRTRPTPPATALAGVNRSQLAIYLTAFEAATNQLWTALRPYDEYDPNFPYPRTSAWDKGSRIFRNTAAAFARYYATLGRLSPPAAVAAAHRDYLYWVPLDGERFRAWSQLLASPVPDYRAEAQTETDVSNTQLSLEQVGGQWERFMIAACQATHAPVPRFIQLHELGPLDTPVVTVP
jgi:hypothetical protein